MAKNNDNDRRNGAQADVVYEYIHRNKFIMPREMSLASLIEALEDRVAWLKEMQAKGVEMAQGPEVGDDYYYLITTDPKVAKEYGFEEVLWEDDDGDDEDGFDEYEEWDGFGDEDE